MARGALACVLLLIGLGTAAEAQVAGGVPPHLGPQAPAPVWDRETIARIVAEEWEAFVAERPQPITDFERLRLQVALQRLLTARLAPALASPSPAPMPALPRRQRPVIVLPGQVVPGAAAPAAAPPVATPPAPDSPAVVPPVLVAPGPLAAGVERAPRAVVADPVIRVEVERALLDTGLFRALGILFEFDDDRILPPSRPTLDAVGEVMVRFPDLRIAVHGHTDNVGAAAYNLDLSLRRAESVRSYLLQTFPEIAGDRIEAAGFGEERPIAPNQTPTGRAMNRRVEFVAEMEEPAAESAPEEAVETFEETLQRVIREELGGGEEL